MLERASRIRLVEPEVQPFNQRLSSSLLRFGVAHCWPSLHGRHAGRARHVRACRSEPGEAASWSARVAAGSVSLTRRPGAPTTAATPLASRIHPSRRPVERPTIGTTEYHRVTNQRRCAVDFSRWSFARLRCSASNFDLTSATRSLIKTGRPGAFAASSKRIPKSRTSSCPLMARHTDSEPT